MDPAIENFGKGARYWKCALQVNPYSYVQTHKSEIAKRFQSEEDYNLKMLEACRRHGIECVGITDHHNIYSSASLAAVLNGGGIAVFPGFEYGTKDGIHMLILWDPQTPHDEIDGYIKNFGILGDPTGQSLGELDAETLLEKVAGLSVAVIAAHVTIPGGLLHRGGEARAVIWKNPKLIAAGIGVPVTEEPPGLQSILLNKDRSYQRIRPVALVHSRDVQQPEAFAHPGASTFIKMQEPCVEALRQAFLDPESRIRSNYEAADEGRVEIIGMSWNGGFLDGQVVRFSNGLNVLIGGRGTGKSTVIESIRFVLERQPLSEPARRRQDLFFKSVLGPGTSVRLFLRVDRPQSHEYQLERTVGRKAVIYDEHGDKVDARIQDMIPPVEVYGQHEIGEIAENADHIRELIQRFVTNSDEAKDRRRIAAEAVASIRLQIEQVEKDIYGLDERLERLPGLLERRKRYLDAGLQEKVAEKTDIDKESSYFETVIAAVGYADKAVEASHSAIKSHLGIIPAIDEYSVEGVPLLQDAEKALLVAREQAESQIEQIRTGLDEAVAEIERVRATWRSVRADPAEERYSKTLRDLAEDGADADAFVKLQREVSRLEGDAENRQKKESHLQELARDRATRLSELRSAESSILDTLVEAAKAASRSLARQVRVTIDTSGQRNILLEKVRSSVTGRSHELIKAIEQNDVISPTHLAELIRAGRPALKLSLVGATDSQLEKLLSRGEHLARELEELFVQPTTTVMLNTAASGVQWRELDRLSTGEKATALLLLLLLDSDTPLIIDQPEDDLDNRYVASRIVEKLREGKTRRQFILSSHNANIPVLGDAEQVIVMTPSENSGGAGVIKPECAGSIDRTAVREQIEEILEGGAEAFQLRREKYGTYV